MALKVKSEKVKAHGKFLVFMFFFVMLLILFAIFFVVMLLIGGYPVNHEYVVYYIDFIPLTIVLPFVIALTSILSFRTSLMHVTPVHNVNIEKIKEFFITKNGFRIVEERDGFMKFEKAKFFSRLLWLNIDKPTIEVKENEILIKVEKHTESVLTPLLVYGKQYDLNLEN